MKRVERGSRRSGKTFPTGPLQRADERKYQRLLSLYTELRTEIRQRIAQRDQYSIQLTVALAAVIALSATGKPTEQPNMHRALLAAPLLSLYYSVLIQYSYAIHKVLALLLRTRVEPEIAKLSNGSTEYELETFYLNHRVPGIRKVFFNLSMFVVTLAVTVVMLLNEQPGTIQYVLILLLCVVYFCLCVVVSVVFGDGPKGAKRLVAEQTLKSMGQEIVDLHRDFPVERPVPRYQAAILLDRDGTVNVDEGYSHDPARLQLIPETVQALRLISRWPVHIVLITNQSGIAKGMYDREQMSAFHAEMLSQLKAQGIRVDAVYFSPYDEYDHATHPFEALMSKPGTGLIRCALHDLQLDPKDCVMIGDKYSDVLAGRASGLLTVKLPNQPGVTDIAPLRADISVHQLEEAVPWLQAVLRRHLQV